MVKTGVGVLAKGKTARPTWGSSNKEEASVEGVVYLDVWLKSKSSV